MMDKVYLYGRKDKNRRTLKGKCITSIIKTKYNITTTVHKMHGDGLTVLPTFIIDVIIHEAKIYKNGRDA